MSRGRHIETDKQPFSVGNEAGRVAAAVALQLQVDAARVIRPRAELQLVVMVREILERTDRQTDPRAHRNTPRAELHLAQLVVKRKPRDVDLARAEEQARRHPETTLRVTCVATDRMSPRDHATCNMCSNRPHVTQKPRYVRRV